MKQPQHPLVRLARLAVERFVRNGRVLVPPPGLRRTFGIPGGVFVSLKECGALRGCIGTVEPVTDCIADEVVRNAIAAASQDPRFRPVDRDELPELSYSVDVLLPFEPVANVGDLDPRQFGVLVTAGSRRGLLLPDIPGVVDSRQQLAIARDKAGIHPREPISISRFRVERYF